MKKTLSKIIAAVLIAVLMCGCGTATTTKILEGGGSEAEIIELSIYAQYLDDDTKVPFDYAKECLAQEYPNVRLKLVRQAQDDGNTLLTLAALGQLPDIFQANTTIINDFRTTGQIMVLDEVALRTGFADKLYPSANELAYSDDGHMYCFPYAGNEYVLWYYNRELFDKCGLSVPHTFDELSECIRVFKENDIVPMALFGQEGWITTAMYDVVATRYVPDGIKGLDEGNRITEAEGYREAAKILQQLVEQGMFEENVNDTNYNTASEMFLSGKAAMFLNGQWYIEDATMELKDAADWMPYPSYSEKAYEEDGLLLSGGGSMSGYAVNRDGEHAELAAEVAAFIAEKYCEAKIKLRNNPFVALDTGAEPESGYPAMMQKLSDSIPKLKGTTRFAWGLETGKLYDSICTNTKRLVSGQYDADEFIEMIDTDVR